MKDKDFEHWTKLIQTKSDRLAKDHAILTSNINSLATRLVWFVAIAGFALINIGGLAEDIVGTKLTNIQLVFLILPWVFVAISSIVTHHLLGRLIGYQDRTQILTQRRIHERMQSWLADADTKTINNGEIFDILNIQSTDDRIRSIAEDILVLAKSAIKWERITLFLMIFGFFWSVCYPLLIFFNFL